MNSAQQSFLGKFGFILFLSAATAVSAMPPTKTPTYSIESFRVAVQASDWETCDLATDSLVGAVLRRQRISISSIGLASEELGLEYFGRYSTPDYLAPITKGKKTARIVVATHFPEDIDDESVRAGMLDFLRVLRSRAYQSHPRLFLAEEEYPLTFPALVSQATAALHTPNGVVPKLKWGTNLFDVFGQICELCVSDTVRSIADVVFETHDEADFSLHVGATWTENGRILDRIRTHLLHGTDVPFLRELAAHTANGSPQFFRVLPMQDYMLKSQQIPSVHADFGHSFTFERHDRKRLILRFVLDKKKD